MAKEKFNVEVTIWIPDSPEEWELYQDDETNWNEVELAAAECTMGLKQTIRKILDGVPPVTATNEHVRVYLEKHRNVGADDTEPRGIARRAILKACKFAGHNTDNEQLAWSVL